MINCISRLTFVTLVLLTFNINAQVDLSGFSPDVLKNLDTALSREDGANQVKKYENYTQNFYDSTVDQIKRVDEENLYEQYQKTLIQKRLDLAVRLCQEDSRACYLIENYQEYKSNIGKENFDKELKLFGLDFFSGYPLSFSSLSNTGVSDDYPVTQGDLLEIVIFSVVDQKFELVVNRDGNIVLPFGEFPVAGKKYAQVKEELKLFIASNLSGSGSSISLMSANTISVYLMGQIQNPGYYTLSPVSKIINAFASSGGFLENASLRNIEVIRDGSSIRNVDMYDFLIFGRSSSDQYLKTDDSILVKGSNSIVQINGEVNRPAKYEIKKGETLNDIIIFAQGLSSNADKRNISISRLNTSGLYETRLLSPEENPELQNGDSISVGSFSGSNVNFVELVGEIRSAGLRNHSAGMKLSDIIDFNRDILDSTYIPFIAIKRFDQETRSYNFVFSDLLSNQSIENFSLMNKDIIYVFSKNDIAFLNSGLMRDYFSDERKIELIDNDSPDSFKNSCLKFLNTFGDNDFISSAMLKFELSFSSDASEDNSQKSECTSFLNNYPELLPILVNRSVPAFGSIRNPGLYPSSDKILPNQLLSIAGGSIHLDQNDYKLDYDFYTNNGLGLKYLRVQRLSQESENGYINLVGEFRFPGKYRISPNTTLDEIYRRAGGLMNSAYTPGAVFTRDSIKEREKLALQKAQSELADILAAAVTSGTIDQSSSDIIGLVQLMNEVSDAIPVGRLVGNFSERNASSLLLESGDTIFMPKMINTVTVTGSVLNPVTVPYDPSFTTRDYIRKAGGFKEFAEESKVYVILPTGAAVKPGNRFFALNQSNIMPGSSIIVPREARTLSGFALVEAISPVLANLSISLASISTITDN